MASISTKQASTEQTSLLGSSNDGVAEYGLPSAPEHIESERRMLTTWQLSSMTVLLAGIQFVWTVELGYGTPYLLSLGLSKPLMTLVWMAGPLSGAAFVVASVIVIAYARELATALARMVYPGQSDNVPDEYQAFVSRVSIILAVVGFYVLDFSINTSQACARALALDLPPLKQQDAANAYAGRMLNLGSVSGYLVGFMDLRSLVPWHTDSQMQALCLIATIVFMVTVTWTCVLVREEPLIKHNTHEESTRTQQAEDGEWTGMLRAILRGVMQLPTPVQRVCNVQFFAWVAWFPFLFFATTWVTEIMARTGDITDPEFVDRATRAGSFALFLYAVASLLCSMALPVFVVDGSERRGISLCRMWRVSLVAMGITLLMTWVVDGVVSATVLIVAMAFPWALAMWAPFALVGEYVAIQAETESVVAVVSEDSDEEEEEEEYILSIQADVPPPPPNAVAVIGKRRSVGSVATSASWKRTHEIIGHANAPTESISSTIQDDAVSSVSATSRSALFLKAPVPPPPSQRVCPPPPQAESPGAKITNDERLESGTILGIHNMYVVFPQFFINGVSSLIFAWLGHHSDGLPRPPGARSVELLAMSTLMSYVSVNDGGVEPVGFVLRIGGVSALVAAGLTVFLYDRQRVREYIAH
ncbi:hypothetical protein GGI17_001680 [Coemansia sp. S146]|nr:hypothetical protein GGI17_001680 [Coemansia sp. S146]